VYSLHTSILTKHKFKQDNYQFFIVWLAHHSPFGITDMHIEVFPAVSYKLYDLPDIYLHHTTLVVNSFSKRPKLNDFSFQCSDLILGKVSPHPVSEGTSYLVIYTIFLISTMNDSPTSPHPYLILILESSNCHYRIDQQISLISHILVIKINIPCVV